VTHRCGKWFVDERESERTIQVAKRLGIWGMPLELKRELSMNGGRIVLRPPYDLQESLGLKGNEAALLCKIGKMRVLLELL